MASTLAARVSSHMTALGPPTRSTDCPLQTWMLQDLGVVFNAGSKAGHDICFNGMATCPHASTTPVERVLRVNNETKAICNRYL
jgi:uncharacterized metal-binding protein